MAILTVLLAVLLLAGSALASDSGIRPFSSSTRVRLMSDSGVRPF